MGIVSIIISNIIYYDLFSRSNSSILLFVIKARRCKWFDLSNRVISSKIKVSNIIGSNSPDAVSTPIRNSHGLRARSTEDSQSRTNNRPAVALLPTSKVRKTLLPSQYRMWQVYELDGYTDGTPLQPGHVWVEYESSGYVEQVKKSEVTMLPKRRVPVQDAHSRSRTRGKGSKKRGNGTGSPARRTLPKLRHNLLTNDSINGQATSDVQCPVGYKFSHSVPPSSRRDGYECEAEVLKVNGECECGTVYVYVLGQFRVCSDTSKYRNRSEVLQVD